MQGRGFLIAMLYLGLVAAPLGVADPSPGEGGAAVQLQDAWVRAMPPGQTRTAAYLTVHNPGPGAVTVTGARADVAGRTEMHTSVEVDGMMRMEPVAVLPVPAGARLVFSPGGLHLMLMDLQRVPAVGERVGVCLEIAGRPPACTSAPVRRDAGVASDAHRHHPPP